MHGGLKVYAGAPAAARHYVEADRGRADDYYLAEGTGVARRFTTTDGRVTQLARLTGEGYEAWVAGRDPDTGEPRGRLRHDEHAVRFVEVVVNGPKTWSLAATLHPDIAAAYGAAQDRAAEQIIAWLSQHAITRVGPRGGQVQVPIEMLEAATIRHFTSRANDPHRHLHLQFLSRVFATEKWRGLHTVGVRDMINAINGHRARRDGHRPGIQRRPRRERLHQEQDRRNTATRRVRRPDERPRRTHRTEPEPLRTGMDRRAPRRNPRSGAAPRLAPPGLGRRSPGQGHPEAWNEPGRTVAHRAARPRLPRPRQAGAPGAHPGRRAGPRPAGRPRACPARRRPVGVEPGRRARGGGAADRSRRRRGRRGRAGRTGRGPHRSGHGPLRAAAGPRRSARAHPGLDLGC